jgi:mono/diheme cytochrome c family protein
MAAGGVIAVALVVGAVVWRLAGARPEPGPVPPPPSAGPRALTAAEQELFAAGSEFYNACMLCHGPNGEGVAGQYPPLARARLVLGSPAKLTRVLVHGMEGPVPVAGQIIDGQMPPAPLDLDREYAAVMTYVRRSFGNDADPVTPEFVAKVREIEKLRVKPWTLAELEDIK